MMQLATDFLLSISKKEITMKKFVSFLLLGSALIASTVATAQQDKSKRKSPPATVTQQIKSGAKITIEYSQPSLKGRTIGNDVEPMQGQVWRMGANEATTLETDKAIKVNGKELPAGKYSIFGQMDGDNFNVMFNTEWKIWGTEYDANKTKTILTIPAKISKTEKTQEMLTYTIDKDGTVKLLWGERIIEFKIS
jgi:hypothetical protein